MSGHGVELLAPPPNMFEPEKTETPAPSAQQFMYKNRLQEFTQKSGIPLPIYDTVNEGTQHSPNFRCTVLVDGTSFTSLNMFSSRKAAEQDVAKVALLGVVQKIKDQGSSFIRKDTVFCKSILNEYAVKMNLEKPTYETIQQEGLLPVFVSSLVFNGVTYTGNAARTKKEAEQLAARAVILSIFDSESGTVISEIIKSKFKLYAALSKVKHSCEIQDGNVPMGLLHAGYNLGTPSSKGKEVEVTRSSDGMPITAIPEPCSGQPTNTPATHPPFHEFRTPKLEATSEAYTLPIVFVPPVLEQPMVVGSTSMKKRNRKVKKQARKKARASVPLPSALAPLSEVPSCSVAQ